MTSRALSLLLLGLLALGAALAPARAGAATAPPTLTRVSPLHAQPGDTLVLHGRGFRPGRATNRVLFRRPGARPVVAKADEATRTRLRVRVPASLVTAGQRPARFALRVLARRLGRRFTRAALSPVVSPIPHGCTADGIPSGKVADSDGDLLPDALEATLGTKACNPDSDGDALQDGWEYQSAVDLNSPGCAGPYPTPCTPALPYPGKRAYPNPLDGSDADVDFDGDWLTARQEFTAWLRHPGRSLTDMWYSDGLQASGHDGASLTCRGLLPPAPPAPGYSIDRDASGCLTDDERDEDGDLLTNVEETSGAMSGQAWWTARYRSENAYRVAIRGTDWLDADTDGDGVVDGLDDQDHDDFLNVEEIERGTASHDADGDPTGVSTGLWVNPFNPCLPSPRSRTCPRGVPLTGDVWAPFQPEDATHDIAPSWPLWSGPMPPHHLIARPS